jgi:hypothetical protein
MTTDWRQVETGLEIPKQNYCDQPYVVVTGDGNWLCALTTGPGLESKPGQHVVATVSADQGHTWSSLIDIEPSSDQMTSWVTLFKVPSQYPMGGRVYAIYNYQSKPEATQHGGWLCYRYSDDHGRTWSDNRYRIPIRSTKRDRENVTGGQVQFFWCIDKPVSTERGVYLGIPKLRSGVPITGGESWVIHSDNLLSEPDPAKIRWQLLPEGEEGIHSPDLGDVQEEQNIEVLSDGSLYMVLRTEIGVVAHTISRDGGRTWTIPQPITYPDGRSLRNPRACPKIWKASNGRFLLWFHNNGAAGWGNSAVRNPVWLSGGVEADGDIAWSQPELLLYSQDPTLRGMSYPDFIEQDGRIWVSETEKMTARVHEIDSALLDALWSQMTASTVTRDGLLLETGSLSPGDRIEIPKLPSLQAGGFTVEMWLELEESTPNQTVMSSYGDRRRGFQITTRPDGALRLEIRDARQRHWFDVLDGPHPEDNVRSLRTFQWDTDPGSITAGTPHHVAFIVDGLANIVSVVVDGRLCDGGDARIQGWSRLNPWFDEINDEGVCRVGEASDARVLRFRLYAGHLATSEVIGNWRAGADA